MFYFLQANTPLWLCAYVPFLASHLRCFTAATLENFQPENDEGKACCLAAASNELERFFRKEDFGRMQVRIN